MNRRRSIVYVGWACCVAVLFAGPLRAGESESNTFRAILELAEIGPDVLSHLSKGPRYVEADWQIMLQVFDRLQRFEDLPSVRSEFANQLSLRSAQDRREKIGQIFDLAGIVDSVQELPLPEKLAERHGLNSVFLCQLRQLIPDPGDVEFVTVLSTDIPKRWHQKQSFHENVRVRGVLIQGTRSDDDLDWQTLLLTNHIAWYPVSEVPTGQLLLARHDMDVALLDEVRHRQPFVKPEISREGEAFYAALTALRQVEQQELVRLAIDNVAARATAWRAQQPELIREHQRLKEKLAAETDRGARTILRSAVKTARDRRGLAAAVIELSELQRSSVAPLFLQPQEEIGELVNFEGVARRAVRIAVPNRTEAEQPNLNAYFEIEIFTADSQNLPIVCCVLQLPIGFPTGDQIREPVRIAGIFFKNWRYRSRRRVNEAGETGRQRQLYTPVLLGKRPTWLNQTADRHGRWSLWGGIAFLAGLLTLWISMSWLAKRDRVARAALRRNDIIDL